MNTPFRPYILNVMIAAVTLFGLSGCQQRKVYRIGVSQCSQDDWRQKMNEEIEREAMFNQDATIEIRSANDSNEKQIADIKYFADNHFDIIIASPNEADAITPVISEIYRRGIPVLIFDRDINGQEYTAHISADNVAMGRDAGNYALALFASDQQRRPTALEIWGLSGSTPARDRHQGFNEAFTAGGGIVVGSGLGHWNQPDAELVADSLLRLFPNVDLIFAHNDRMAIGASKVACRLGLQQIKIIGIDAAPNIGLRAVADSVIDATFLYPTEGHLLIQTAMAILRGEPYDREIMLPTSSAVDQTNADLLLIQDEALRHETSKMKALKFQIDEYWSRHTAQTLLFYAVIAILVLVFISLFLVLKAYWQHKRHQQILMTKNKLLEEQSQHQKELNERLQEATRSKLSFYTNVSHDLRTPLTLISEPIKQLTQASNLTPRQQTLIKIAHRNVMILRRLINQILDFRKYENGKLTLHLTEVNFSQEVCEWAESFREVALKRDIKLILEAPQEAPIHLALDVEKMERIFFNLIGNALKFTPNNGTIRISYMVEGEVLTLRISDTGQGIAQEELNKIFDRFYQVDHVHPQGSGIGLSLVKAFVQMHDGTIHVESTVGHGTSFTIHIPVRHVAAKATSTSHNIDKEEITVLLQPTELPTDAPIGETTDSERPRLLVIDDNADIRALITQLLGDEYEVHEAENGKVGLARAARLVPDLIICDIMMPVMDGLECCRRIKAEISTSHIPVLMLTACSMDEQRLEGYESGADGYISKPFSSDLLRARCRNLIANRKRVRDLYAEGTTEERPAKPEVEDEFYARFLKLFYADISNPDLSIEQIASNMGLGHSQFYRKIKALTNYTPVELMRQLRLKQGRRLLTTTSKSISEIAYEVGFSSPAYFTKCYRAAFGETPSELRDKLGATTV